MAIRDTNGHAGVALAGGPEELWPVSGSEAAEPPDWRSLYERERERAEAAEARAEELRWAEVRARSDAGSWKWRWEASRRRLRKVVAETREARRAARDALALQREVERLHGLLREAGVDAGKRSTVMALRMEVARLRKKGRALEKALDARAAEVRNLHKDRIEADAVIPALRRQLSKALRRSRRQKATIGSLTLEKARLGKRVRVARRRIERLEGQLAKLRASRSGLPKGKSRGACERQERPRSGRRRGQQPGAPGHGRTERPGLEERTEEHNPPSDARVCGGCGSPYTANGAEESALVEIEVRAHRRVIRRPRWRRTCGCASSPAEVSAPPVPRLFARTPYGTSVWARFLFERYACLRPLHRVSSWLSDQGLPVSPGTLADSVHRLAPLFEPVGAAILAHQNGASLRHADETSWRVRALREGDGSGYAWLWTSAGRGAVYFHVDPSRSAEAAMKLFEGTRCPTVLVCDRYSAYKKLARLLGGRVTLSFCWAHMRRDFIRCAAGHVHLDGWCREWLGRIATVYRLNKARLAGHDPGLDRQSPAFDAAHEALEEALGGMFAAAERQLARLPPEAREGKPLRSLLNHREGLSVFLDRPRVPLDNNLAERLLRGPAIGRRLSFGSDSETGARFTAVMYSVIATLSLNGIDVLRWLEAWLTACAHNGGRPPDDLSPWLPWSMSEERKRSFTAPG
jgi:transposase